MPAVRDSDESTYPPRFGDAIGIVVRKRGARRAMVACSKA
jgi:hypothetical protein